MNTHELLWCRNIPGKLMSSKDVHVWRAVIDLSKPEVAKLSGILSIDESERARRFHFERDRDRFIVSHGILRNILGHYMDIAPQLIRFENTFYGKPELTSNSGEATLRFSLSHSNRLALYAVSAVRNIGIDIEHVREDVNVQQISQRFYCQNERSALDNTEENERLNLFFKYWTKKEALLKAIGQGMSFPMDLCDVSSTGDSVLSPVMLPGNNEAYLCWYVQDLFPGDGYVAAIAVDSSNYNISYFHYS